MIEGGGSRTLTKAKGWLYKYPLESEKLLSQLGDVVITYLVEQVKAGAQVN
jgi:uroporphyrinogen decarboxylase